MKLKVGKVESWIHPFINSAPHSGYSGADSSGYCIPLGSFSVRLHVDIVEGQSAAACVDIDHGDRPAPSYACHLLVNKSPNTGLFHQKYPCITVDPLVLAMYGSWICGWRIPYLLHLIIAQ